MMQATLKLINLYQCEKSFATGERILTSPYILYVHKGTGIFKIGVTSFIGTMGDLFFCPAEVGNTIIADGEDPFLLTGINFSANGNQLQEESFFAGFLPAVNILANPFLISLIRQMIQEHQFNRIHAKEICSSLLTALLLEMARIARIGMPNSDNVQFAMLEHLKGNRERTVTYDEMAKKFSYHKSSVNRIVKVATGMSPREYQIVSKLRMASELLTYSNRPIGEIASLCGYASAVFFSRQFKGKMGQTPAAYRSSRQYPI